MPTPATLPPPARALAPHTRDIACFLQGRDPLAELLLAWRASRATPAGRCVLVGESGSAWLGAWRRWPEAPPTTFITPRAAGLLDKPFSPSRILQRLLAELGPEPGQLGEAALVVDMDWLLQAPSALANGAIWGYVIDRFLAEGVQTCLSVYHRRHLPERDLLAGLHAHAAVLAPDGCRVNPYQLPLELSAGAGTTQAARLRLDHWLAHLSPTLRAQESAAARGGATNGFTAGPLSGGESNPLSRLRGVEDVDDESADTAGLAPERWKVRCFGSLRVYRINGQALQWQDPDRPGKAGATRKLRGLFAMLLMGGDRGVSSAELVDALWPEADTPEKGLNRLHHTVNALRRCLLPATAERPAPKPGRHPYLQRQDQRYYLRPPANSWVDIEEFPQLCRQGGDLLRDGRQQEALLCFESALQLYTGDLFADLPASLTEGVDADWCAGTRAWLRELYLKVHGDCARIHRETGRPLQAAAHCRQLLEMDPASAFAHAELMRLHAAEGRREALERQFQLYRQATLGAGHRDLAPLPLMDLYVELMRELGPVQTPRNSRARKA